MNSRLFSKGERGDLMTQDIVDLTANKCNPSVLHVTTILISISKQMKNTNNQNMN